MSSLIPAAVGAVGNIAGALIGGSFADKSAEASSRATADANRANIEMQNDFARHGIGWKIDDARAHGISPLVALGAPTSMPTTSIVPDYSSSEASSRKGAGWADAFRNTGQDLSRAMSMRQDDAQRAYDQQMMSLNLQKAQQEVQAGGIANSNAMLNSQLIRSRMALLNKQTNSIGLNHNGYNGRGGMLGRTEAASDFDASQSKQVLDNLIPTSNDRQGVDALRPASSLYENLDGSTAVFPSNDFTNVLDADFPWGAIHGTEWYFHNRVFPWAQRAWAKTKSYFSSKK
ncbi:MAG: DNA pilot protein [Microvirus sp.]|nr:MAG: DNA pilot protein [Microvirus sp.]